MNFDVNINPGDLIEITRPNISMWNKYSSIWNKWSKITEIDTFKFLVVSISEPEFTRFNYFSNFDDNSSLVTVNIPINLIPVELPRSVLHENGYTINIEFSSINEITLGIRLKLTQSESVGFSVIYDGIDGIDKSIHASINGNQIDLNKLILIRN